MQKTAQALQHFVQFYERDDFLLEEVSGFLSTALQAGDAGLVIATPEHRNGLEQRLNSFTRADGRYIAMDAATTLSRIMVNGWPDEQRFEEVLGGVMRQATQSGTRQVRVFAEMASLLWAEGSYEATCHLEELWNNLAESHSFSLLCAYPMKGFHSQGHASPFLNICNAHSQVRPAKSFSEASGHELQRQIALLQQKAVALEAEVAKREESERLLRRREWELEDFLANAVEGVHRIGPSQEILWANKAELSMLGYTPEEYIGHHIAEFHVDREVVEDILGKLQSGEPIYDYPARLRCKDGSVKYVEIHSNALIENGELVHTRCFTRDVTERVLLEREIRDRFEQLAEVDRRKDKFLATLGHEMRTPLATMTTAVELMRLRGDDPASLTRLRETVERQIAPMTRLVDDLLDIARISRGRIVLKAEEVQLQAIVESAIETVRSLLDERSHHLAIDMSEEPIFLFGDAVRLVQVVANLLSNAAKYTDVGGNIGLSGQKDGPNLPLRVRDNGVGLTPELLERVFEPFVQADGTSDRARGGLGIGLALVRNLVHLHGGRVEARSEGPGRGSEFIVWLPLAQSPR